MDFQPMTGAETCPACGAAETSLYARCHGWRAAMDRTFEFLQCARCQSVFLSAKTPQPRDIYTTGYFEPPEHTGVLKLAENLWGNFGFSLRLRRSPSLPAGAKVLDVGCGAGGWLLFLQQHGYEVYGLEPSTAACEVARKRGLTRISQGSLDNHSLPAGTFDAITGIHCMEHAPDPRAFVRQAVPLLKPGGWLGVAIPNIASWEARHAREIWWHLDPPYHLCMPTPKAMRELMSASGLTDIRIACPILDYCQSLFYAWKRSRNVPLWQALLSMPPTLAANALLSLRRETGTMEFWGRRP